MWASVYREPLKGIPKIKKWKGNQLSNNILNDLVGNVEPTAEIVNKRRRVLNTISEIVTKFIPGSEVGVFGSVASGMDTSTSDVDVIIFFRNTVVPIDVHAVLRGVKIKLKEESDSGADDIKGSYLFLESSRVPVVKIVTDLGVSVDISCQNTWTLVGNRIVSNYLAEFPMLAPLTRLVKLWLKRRSIRPSRYGGLSSWGWSLLVIFAYQQNKKQMSQFCKNKDLAGALTLFFDMYAYKINVRSQHVISVRSGRLISRRSFSSNLPPQLRASWNPPSNRSFLAIEEPVIRPPVDIASHIGDDVWQDVEAEMRRAYLLLHKGGSSGLELLFSKRVDMSQIVSQLCRSTLTNHSSNQDEHKNKAEESTLTSLLSPDSKECCFVIVSRGAVASSGGDRVLDNKKDELIVRLAVPIVSSNSSESKADINSGSKRSLVRVRLLTCCEAKGSRLCDKIKSDGYCPNQVSLYRHKLTNITMMVRNDRVLPGIVVFDSSKRKDSIRDQVSDSSRVSAWSKFFLDPSDSLVYFKMCRNLNRLKLLNKPSSKRKQIIQRKKHPAIVKFSTKRRSSSPSSVEMLNKSSDLQSMMQSPMKRRRRSFD
eukprot:g4704.t1